MTAFPAHDTDNVISNVDGHYLQELTSRAPDFVAVTVSSCTPNTVPQGAATPVTIAGTGFLPSPEVTVSGTGVTVGSVVRVSATSITATLTATGGAALTARSLTVSNAGAVDQHDADTKSSAFTVVAP